MFVPLCDKTHPKVHFHSRKSLFLGQKHRKMNHKTHFFSKLFGILQIIL